MSSLNDEIVALIREATFDLDEHILLSEWGHALVSVAKLWQHDPPIRVANRMRFGRRLLHALQRKAMGENARPAQRQETSNPTPTKPPEETRDHEPSAQRPSQDAVAMETEPSPSTSPLEPEKRREQNAKGKIFHPRQTARVYIVQKAVVYTITFPVSTDVVLEPPDFKLLCLVMVVTERTLSE